MLSLLVRALRALVFGRMPPAIVPPMNRKDTKLHAERLATVGMDAPRPLGRRVPR
jgi:hypothetical protein